MLLVGNFHHNSKIHRNSLIDQKFGVLLPILRTFSMQIRGFVSRKHDKWQGILTVALVLAIFPVSLFSVSPSTNLLLFQNPTPTVF